MIKLRKKNILSIILSIVLTFSLVGCNNSNLDERVQKFELKSLELDNALMNLENESKKLQQEITQLRGLIPEKQIGKYSVNATELNIRGGQSLDAEIIGTLEYGTKINVVNTSNPLWYEITLNLDGYKVKAYEKNSKFIQGNNVINLKNYHIKDNRLNGVEKLFVSSQYILATEIIKPDTDKVPKGDKPFVYGIIFFDNATKDLLREEIWNNIGGELISLGYTGIDVVALNRETFDEDFETGKFDAVEAAPGQFARINDKTKAMEVFAKDIIDGDENYRGIILVNKNSGITDPSQLKGKKVLTGKEFSESSYQYQKALLKDIYDIDISKDLSLEMDKYHQEIFYKVASGQAEVGFCGDFVMKSSYNEMKNNLAKSKIDLKSESELKSLRENVLVLDIRGKSPIPNNPHALKKNLYEDSNFTKKLFDSVKKIYSNNKEGYDIKEAKTKEYDILLNFE